MIFDQYSRYKACSDLFHQAGFSSGNSILDIGSGPECLLGEFMLDADITYVDPLITERSTHNKIKGTIFSDQLDEQTFEFVSAVDVFEHIPPEQRQLFLSRLSFLCKKTLIIGFPSSDASDAHETDKLIDDQHIAIFGYKFPWLDEHQRYGLPSLSATVFQLEKLGWQCSTIGHGHTPWLKELLSFVICIWNHKKLKKIVLDISEQFNQKLYSYDFRAPFYRNFIVASREAAPLLLIPNKEKNDSEAEKVFEDLMTYARRQYFVTSMKNLLKDAALLTERDAALVERDAALVERDTALAERDATIIKYDLAIAERDELRAEYEASLEEIRQYSNSHSWRITRPLRFIARLYRFGLLEEDKRRLYESARQRYYKIPLPNPIKRSLSSIYHNIFRKIIRSTWRSSNRSLKFHPPSIKPACRSENTPDYIIWGIIDWHFRHQRPQQLALAIAATGRRVFYISPVHVDDDRVGFEAELIDKSSVLFQIKLFLQGSPNIYTSVPSAPIIDQLKGSIGEMLNWAECQRIIALVQHPFWGQVACALPNSQLIYDCMDHHAGFGKTGETLVQMEKELFCKSDLTITTSTWLYEAVAKHTRCRALIRNAVDFDHFSNAPDKVHRDYMGRRIIGYYGAIAEWFDLDLLAGVAKRHTECCVMLIGADSINAKSKLGKLPNVIFTGEVPYSKLPYYLYGFDMCLLPFKVIPLTLATNPVKAYEYLSAGKPVVSVNIPEMKQFGDLVYVAADHHQFLEAVDHLLNRPEPDEIIQRRKEFAKGQTWKHRVDEFIQCVEAKNHEPQVSIIVVTFNNLELTKKCLYSIEQHSQYENLEIIVVDNASSDGTPEYLEIWASSGTNRKIILNDLNKGFATANNQGIKIAAGDYFVLLNNDTYVTPGWVRTLVSHLKRDEGIGIIGPVTNNIGNEARIDIFYTNMEEMFVKSAGYTRRNIGKVFPLRTTAFFCVMLRRETVDKVGLLDEAFGQGFFEDDDYCRRIEKLGFRIMCAEDVFIHHYLSASFDKINQRDRRQLFENNKKIYEAKWGEWLPHGYRKEKSDLKETKYIDGQCNVCGKKTRFSYQDVSLWRESLNCEHCQTTSRYRSIARGVLRAIRDYTGIESSSIADLPHVSRKKLNVYDTQPPFYHISCAYPLPDILKTTGWIKVELSQYKPEQPLGKILAKGITNQNLESLTFADESQDIVITSDVMEHVRLDDRAHNEIYRVLKKGGIYIFTVPHCREWDETLVRVQVNDPENPTKDTHLLEPEYHGDTNSKDKKGVLAYRTYGREIENDLAKVGFEVEYSRERIDVNGILNTELYYCKKGLY